MAGARKLFEEVNEHQRDETRPRTGVIDGGRPSARRAIRIWLIMLFALVTVMIAVGGLTRLTDSGLSITEWKPISGALPPLSDADWASEFDKYRAIPEYQLQNRGMSLAEFKYIYWWEWGHRQLGRIVGLVWAIGFLFFFLRRAIPVGWTGRLLIPGILGGIQGAVGWWMVSSGLTGTMLDVASYRLALHLGLAFVILGLLAWYVFELGQDTRALLQRRRARERRLFFWGGVLVAATLAQITIGALVAGIDAGRTYTDWPLMAGGFLPPFPFELTPVWRNFFENEGLVQFIHRMFGYALFLLALFVWAKSRRSPTRSTRTAFNIVLAALTVQVAIGIVTVIYGAPVAIALVHQLGGVVVWVVVLFARFLAGYPLAHSINENR